jgi:Spy/CpxP family protein refolding chaperone
MKKYIALGAIALLAACGTSTEPTAPLVEQQEETVDLVQQLDVTRGAAIDRAGIGGSELPDSLRLTDEQKAQIEALHEAYRDANAADIAALKAIEEEARAAMRAGKSREEVSALLARAEPIMARLRAAFAKLQADIRGVYTSAQRAWIDDRGSNAECRRDVLSQLSERQVQEIRQLKERFAAAIADELANIRAVLQAAREAKAAGASAEEIRQILARAEESIQKVRAAERALKVAILNVLTDEQKRDHCLIRALLGGL